MQEAVSVGDLIAYVFLGVGAILSLFEVEEVLVTFGVRFGLWEVETLVVCVQRLCPCCPDFRADS